MSLITNIICDDFALFGWAKESSEQAKYASDTFISNNGKLILSTFGVQIDEPTSEQFKNAQTSNEGIDLLDQISEKSYDFHKLNFQEIDSIENAAERQIMLCFFNEQDGKYYNYSVNFNSMKKVNIVKHSLPINLNYICAGNHFGDLNAILQLGSMKQSLSQIATDLNITPKQKILRLVKITKQAYDIIYSLEPKKTEIFFMVSIKGENTFKAIEL